MNLVKDYFCEKYFSEEIRSEIFENEKSDTKILFFDRVFRRHHVANDPVNGIVPTGKTCMVVSVARSGSQFAIRTLRLTYLAVRLQYLQSQTNKCRTPEQQAEVDSILKESDQIRSEIKGITSGWDILSGAASECYGSPVPGVPSA